MKLSGKAASLLAGMAVSISLTGLVVVSMVVDSSATPEVRRGDFQGDSTASATGIIPASSGFGFPGISAEQARGIAVIRAGGGVVRRLEVRFEDEIMLYDIDVVSGGSIYAVLLDASDGGLISMAASEGAEYNHQTSAVQTIVAAPVATRVIPQIFSPTTLDNISFDSVSRTFRIPKADGLNIGFNQAEHSDLYHQRLYIITLPQDASGYFGLGTMHMSDSLLRSVTVGQDAQGNTQLIFQGTQILAIETFEDAANYYVRVMRPQEKYPRIVVIDPGHGGSDPGAVRRGVRESDLNLAVARHLLELIEANDSIRAYTTRSSDVHMEVRERAYFGNQIGDLFISIHHNASNDAGTHGVETLYSRRQVNSRSLDSRAFAEIMQQNKIDELGSRGLRVRSRGFAVLRRTTIPAAMVELGFMSNSRELDRMITEEFQRSAARAIYNGILEAFEVYTPPR